MTEELDLGCNTGSVRDLSDIHSAIEAKAIALGWLNPLHPQLEQALRNLAKRSPLARYEPNRKTFYGLLLLLEWPELQRLEERLNQRYLEAASGRAIARITAC